MAKQRLVRQQQRAAGDLGSEKAQHRVVQFRHGRVGARRQRGAYRLISARTARGG